MAIFYNYVFVVLLTLDFPLCLQPFILKNKSYYERKYQHSQTRRKKS